MEQAAQQEVQEDAQQVVPLIISSVNQLRETEGLEAPDRLDSHTTLFGGDGFLDSMSLVTLIVVIEKAIEEKFGRSVSLADPGAMSQEHSPYRTIGSLAAYISQRTQAA